MPSARDLALPAAVVLSAVIRAAAQGPAPPPPAPRTGSVVATVATKMGTLVTDLKRDDFEIVDNGKRRPVTSFENETGPIALLVLVDRSGSLVWDPELVWSDAKQFVAAGVRPGDRVRVGTFSSKILIGPADFTSDRAALQGALTEVAQGAGWTPLWDATSTAVASLATQPGSRVLLIFSDNKDSPDRSGTNVTLADVRARALSDDVIVYGIGLAGKLPHGAVPPLAQGRGGRGGGGRGGAAAEPLTPSEDAIPDPGLKLLADESGGDYFEFEPGSDLTNAFTFIANELHQRYVIGFDPATDGKVHTLEVRVKAPNLVVRARRTYLAK